MKKRMSREAAYVTGVALTALGTAFVAAAGFGVSMVVAPAWLIHLKLGISFGTAEYAFQAVLLCLMMLALRAFRPGWLFSFPTAVFYGLLLDIFSRLAGLCPGLLPVRAGMYVFGLAVTALGIAFLFHTYLPPEVYELIVKECSPVLGLPLHRFKLIYDICSLLAGVGLSLLFFGRLEGISWGTLAAALFTGPLIRFFSRFMKNVEFFTRFEKARAFFEKDEG